MININNAKKLRVVQLLGHKNQYVIIYQQPDNDYVISFYSYDSLIAVYSNNDEELFINWDKWDYSITTLKHFKEFINKWTCFTYETKMQFIAKINHSESCIYLFNER